MINVLIILSGSGDDEDDRDDDDDNHDNGDDNHDDDDNHHDHCDGYLAWCNQGSGGGVALANQLMTEHWTMRALSIVSSVSNASTEPYEH